MIEIQNVSKSYCSKGSHKSYRPNGSVLYPALNGITLSVKEGEMTAIIGESGAGKSTLLHILGCIDSYDSGNVIVDGVELKTLEESKAAEYRNTTVGIVLQNFALLPDFDVCENIILPLRFSNRHLSKKNMVQLAKDTARTVGIEALLHKKISELSGGEKQRVAIARALVTSPKYLLADEPTGALDSKNTLTIVELFKKISKTGVGVVIITHDKEVSSRCDAVWELKDGVVVGTA